MANAGRVAIVPKGDYSSSTAYNRLDLVRYNEKAYVAKKANTGILPTNTEYWMLMTSDGITIDTALSDTSTNPVQNKVVKTALDNIQTTSRAALSTAGWYRVAKLVGTVEIINHYTCLFSLVSRYGSDGCITSTFLLERVTGKLRISPIGTLSAGTNPFTKVRVTTEGTTAYLEVYYLFNVYNICMFSVLGSLSAEADLRTGYTPWKKLDFIPTSETVSGVTVTTTYDIPANASPVTDLDLVQLKGTEDFLNTSILDKAIELPFGIYQYRLGGARYTGGDLPTDSAYWWYSTATIYKRNDVSISVELHCESFNTIAVNSYNGQRWTGWGKSSTTADLTTALAGYLPLSGGTITSDGFPIVLDAKATDYCFIPFKSKGTLLGYLGLNGANNPVYADTNGSSKTLHHDGNSAKVVVSETAPTDTSALWVDNTNKKTKAYIDGAWTVIA